MEFEGWKLDTYLLSLSLSELESLELLPPPAPAADTAAATVASTLAAAVTYISCLSINSLNISLYLTQTTLRQIIIDLHTFNILRLLLNKIINMRVYELTLNNHKVIYLPKLAVPGAKIDTCMLLMTKIKCKLLTTKIKCKLLTTKIKCKLD